MFTRTTTIAAAAIAASTTISSATVADPAIIAPFQMTEVTFEWVGSSAGYTGNLNWIDPDQPTIINTLWNNKDATTGQSSVIPRLYTQGERIDFVYDVVKGGIDAFSTADSNDWNQFEITQESQTTLLVGIEDIRLPRGDADYNDAMFKVNFASVPVPAPGSAALLAVGGALFSGRTRRRC